MTIFLLFRSNFPNPDGVALLEKVPQGVALQGAHVTHDEMLELYVHSRFYHYTNRLLGWSVGESYQVLSAVAGGVFLFILVLLTYKLIPDMRVEFLGLMLSGGYVQLFFGDIENYTLVTAAILLYLSLVYLYLEGRVRLWVPSLTLSVAIGFHLLAGWLLPSLAYLFVVSKRRGEIRGIVVAAAALVFPLGALLVFLHFNGLPIQRLFDSSHVSGMGGHYVRYIAPLRLRYYGGIVNVIVLLLPAVIMIPALVYFRRLGSDSYSRCLQIAGFATLVFPLVWRAQLGVYEDWNLFAPGMVPVAMLVSRSLCAVGGTPRMRVIVRALLLTGSVNTLMWVLSNHCRWT